jgi:hypothetical protein
MLPLSQPHAGAAAVLVDDLGLTVLNSCERFPSIKLGSFCRVVYECGFYNSMILLEELSVIS